MAGDDDSFNDFRFTKSTQQSRNICSNIHKKIHISKWYENSLRVSAKVAQMSAEVLGCQEMGLWVSEVACKPVAQGAWQP